MSFTIVEGNVATKITIKKSMGSVLVPALSTVTIELPFVASATLRRLKATCDTAATRFFLKLYSDASKTWDSLVIECDSGGDKSLDMVLDVPAQSFSSRLHAEFTNTEAQDMSFGVVVFFELSKN